MLQSAIFLQFLGHAQTVGANPSTRARSLDMQDLASPISFADRRHSPPRAEPNIVRVYFLTTPPPQVVSRAFIIVLSKHNVAMHESRRGDQASLLMGTESCTKPAVCILDFLLRACDCATAQAYDDIGIAPRRRCCLPFPSSRCLT